MQPSGQDVPERKPSLTETQQAAVRRRASSKAYEALDALNRTQQKVTEEELESRATADAVSSTIAMYPNLYGEPGESIKLYLSVYCQIWRDGGAVVSLLERVAILQAQEDKREDLKWGWGRLNDPIWIAIKAQQASFSYVLGKKMTAEAFLKPPTGQEAATSLLTEPQQAAVKIYGEAYTKAYQLYQPPKPKRFFGLF